MAYGVLILANEFRLPSNLQNTPLSRKLQDKVSATSETSKQKPFIDKKTQQNPSLLRDFVVF